MFDRAEGYLGVMIDDLVTRGITEPYRMFTSRAEYRLTLRADNADQRLTGKGIALGCVGRDARGITAPRWRRSTAARTMARVAVAHAKRSGERSGLALRKDGQRRTAFELLSYPNIGIGRSGADLAGVRRARRRKSPTQLEIDAKYDVYLSRQAADVESYRRDESLELPDDLDYAALPGLSNEVRQKLQTASAAHDRAGRPDRRRDAGGADVAGRPCAPRNGKPARMTRGKPSPQNRQVRRLTSPRIARARSGARACFT